MLVYMEERRERGAYCDKKVSGKRITSAHAMGMRIVS
jgi:hypothetical protein